jgi:GDP-4-dehydro-6-deoxy-D-mannose reductase
MLGYQYFMSYGMEIVRTRGFNHEGPRRAPVFVMSDFAKQIADIERGLKPPVLRVGNLDAKRDFTDVRDMVRAYWLALEKGKPGEVHNLCQKVLVDPRDADRRWLTTAKIRGNDAAECGRRTMLAGDCTKFRADTGGRRPFEQTCAIR